MSPHHVARVGCTEESLAAVSGISEATRAHAYRVIAAPVDRQRHPART